MTASPVVVELQTSPYSNAKSVRLDAYFRLKLLTEYKLAKLALLAAGPRV